MLWQLRFSLALSIVTRGLCLHTSRPTYQCPDPPPEGCHCEGHFRTVLRCSGSGLTEIPSLSVEEASTLHTLDVSHNDIRGSVSLDSVLTGLQRLFLEHNSITDLMTSDGDDGDWSLFHLDVSGNDLTRVPGLLNQMSALRHLDLSDNNIDVLQWDRFSHLTNLRKLYLEENPVVHFENTVSLPTLQILFITPPDQTVLGSLPSFPMLRTLSISGTRVSFGTSEPWFMELPHLRHLAYTSVGETLADTDVTDIPVQVLGGQLVHLSLSNNSLPGGKSFWGWLEGFTALESLDLSSNDLETYDVNVFRNMPNLEVLNLEGNRPLTVSSGLFTDLPNLTQLNVRDNGLMYINMNDHVSAIVPDLVVRLADNRWQCGCKLHWLKRLIERQLEGESWHLEGHEILHEISCYYPENLRGQLIKDIDIGEMTC